MPYTRTASSSRYFLHSILLLSTSTQNRMTMEIAPRDEQKREWHVGVARSSMIALDTNGPTKELVRCKSAAVCLERATQDVRR